MNLREHRERKKITQWGLKKLTGIYPTRISLFENGYLSLTEREKRKIARALGVSVADIDWTATSEEVA